MFIFISNALFLFQLVSYSINEVRSQDDSSTLVLLHVLFRHGDRTPNLKEVYPKDPYINYTYPPLGYGQLTEAGKLREYSIGSSLRHNYINHLGVLTPSSIVARTTDYERTKLSCGLVLAGLLALPQPKEVANSQCYFQKKDKDQVLGDPSTFCSEFKDLYNEQSTKLKGFELYNSNKDFYKYILDNTGWNIEAPSVSSELYYLIKSQDTLGLQLPEWTRSIWPDELTIRAADEYYVHTETTKMRRIATGQLLRKVLDDTERRIDQKNTDTKLFLYSGHDFNLAFLLIVLEVFQPHVPPYGAYLTLEVHHIDDVYGFKLFYEDYSSTTKKLPLDIKGCGTFCPIKKFRNMFSKYLPLSGECESS